METDLDARIKNLGRTFAMKAASAKEALARLEAARADPRKANVAESFDTAIADARALAERWGARHREVTRGNILQTVEDRSDGEYMNDYRDVIADAYQAGRVAYRETPGTGKGASGG